MSGLVNIGADNAGDAHYRYKMPKLIAKVCVLPPFHPRAGRECPIPALWIVISLVFLYVLVVYF